MKNIKPSYIESGLLSLFSIFTFIQWLILGLAFLGLDDNSDTGDPILVILMLLHSSLLLLYLRNKWLQRMLRRVYLPFALLGATFVPIIAHAMAVSVRLQNDVVGEAAAGQTGLLILWLFTPLMVVATQYGFFAVIIFSLITTGLEFFFGAGLANEGSVPLNVLFEAAFIRNLIFLSIGFIISRLISEQRRQRKSLQEANQQLTQLAVTLEQLAISRERNRMARDLHDTLAHTLSAVAIQVEAVTTIWDSSPELARQRINMIRDVTRDGLQETRKALHALRTNPIEDLGLAMALQTMAEKAAERAGFRVHVTISDTLLDLTVETELNIYRVAEEALNNAVQHAEATDLWLRLSHEKKEINLQIRDNGIGFDSDAVPPEGHFGLVGMKERATLCKADLQIESEPEIGTQIIMQIRE